MNKNIITVSLFFTLSILISCKYIEKEHLENGSKYFIRGDYNYAIREFTLALDNNPKLVLAYSKRGDVYFEMKNFESARIDYAKAIQLEPNNAIYYNNYGCCNFNLKNYENAIKVFTKAIELQLNNTKWMYNRGISFYFNNNYEKAIDDFTRAIEFDNTDSRFYFDRGFLYYEIGDYERSIKDFETGLKINPNDIEANKHLKIIRQESRNINLVNTKWRRRDGFNKILNFGKYDFSFEYEPQPQPIPNIHETKTITSKSYQIIGKEIHFYEEKKVLIKRSFIPYPFETSFKPYLFEYVSIPIERMTYIGSLKGNTLSIKYISDSNYEGVYYRDKSIFFGGDIRK
jgi:tetratricopeptide (TPR) repeat protein